MKDNSARAAERIEATVRGQVLLKPDACQPAHDDYFVFTTNHENSCKIAYHSLELNNLW
ncbi:hypothetical protein J6590_036739 [Homalodisca vitripennis]|nr:hypothetical protein J6590_036739 [Homalodisca vitripennis]